MASALASLHTTLKLLSDPVRLRLCALLAEAELAVQELVAVTGMQQSRISNHLALLKRAHLVRDRREGTWSFHSLVEPSDQGSLSPSLFAATVQSWLRSDEGERDRRALRAVLDHRRARSRETHDRLAEQWSVVGQDFVFGTVRSELLAQAWPVGPKVADLGCGAGFLAHWLGEHGAQVIAVDHSERMLGQARRGKGRPSKAVEYRQGDLEALPLADGEVDVVFSHLVWHHLADHVACAREILRVLRPGGVAVLSDLLPHDADWMRERMGDLRLGLKQDELVAVLARAGLHGVRAAPLLDRYRVAAPSGEPVEFPLFVVRGAKPAADG